MAPKQPLGTNMDTPSAEVIDAVLRGYYTHQKTSVEPIASPIDILANLSALSKGETNNESKAGNVDSILVLFEKHYPKVTLSPAHHSILAFVDDSLSEILHRVDVDFRIEAYIRNLAPYIAVVAIEETPVIIMKHHPLLNLIDMLIHACLGWNEDLGILGEQFIEKTDVILDEFITGKINVSECDARLRTFFEKEQSNYHKRESQLCTAQMKVFDTQKGRFTAADTLNKIMLGQSLPLFIIFMLQGTWFAFLQDVVKKFGDNSQEWETIRNLTESIVRMMQPSKENSTRTQSMDELTRQIGEFSQQTFPQFTAVDNCVADIVAEFEAIKRNQASPACKFELLTLHESKPISEPSVINKISKVKKNQWFLFDDHTESGEKVARLKLILNWPEAQKLIFTNHNRRKVLILSYGDFAEYFSQEIISPLTPLPHVYESIRKSLAKIIQEVRQQKEKVAKTQENVKRKKLNRNYVNGRNLAMDAALEQQQHRTRIKYQRALILRKKARKKILLAQKAVSNLNVDAWVKLPLMEGVLTPCRLVAIISAVDNYIFTNRAGIKVAEHTSSQLSHMIVTENSEILDTGAEFENVLASVITGLREDKDKSYDELTGMA